MFLKVSFSLKVHKQDSICIKVIVFPLLPLAEIEACVLILEMASAVIELYMFGPRQMQLKHRHHNDNK